MLHLYNVINMSTFILIISDFKMGLNKTSQQNSLHRNHITTENSRKLKRNLNFLNKYNTIQHKNKYLYSSLSVYK